MGEAVKPFQHGCKMKKCTQAVALKSCVQQFLSNLQEGMGVQQSLQRMIAAFLK